MWNTLLLNILISIAIIAITHHIWDYLKANYSTQKTKDLAEIHASKYKTILNDLERQTSAPNLCITNHSLHKELQPFDLRDSLRYAPEISPVNPRNLLAYADAARPDFFAIKPQYISVEEQAWMRAELDSFIQSL